MMDDPAKQEVIQFATSLVHDTEYQPDVTEQFLQLLIETSLAAPFYAQHKQDIPQKHVERFRKIHDGIKELNTIHDETLQTLDDAPIPYYLMKEWVAPWPHRYSCDVDILIHPDNLPQLHQYLHDNDYLVDGAEISYPEELTQALFALNTDQTQLQKCITAQQKQYRERRTNKEQRTEEAAEQLSHLQTAEQEYLKEADIRESYKEIAEDRTVETSHMLVEINAEIHELFAHHVTQNPTAREAYTEYDAIYQKVQPSLIEYRNKFGGAKIAKEQANSCPGGLAYRRGAEFLEVETQPHELADSSVETVDNKIAPTDNFVLNAAHFCNLLQYSKGSHSFQGFLKYLLDGAFLLKQECIEPEKLRHRAKHFDRTNQVSYYTSLLNETDLADITTFEHSTLYLEALQNIPTHKLLFNEKSVWLYALQVYKQVETLLNEPNTFIRHHIR